MQQVRSIAITGLQSCLYVTKCDIVVHCRRGLEMGQNGTNRRLIITWLKP